MSCQLKNKVFCHLFERELQRNQTKVSSKGKTSYGSLFKILGTTSEKS